MNAPSQDTTLQATTQVATPPVYTVTGYRSIQGPRGIYWNATIRCDGRKVGMVFDDGAGGEYTYNMLSKSAESELLQAADDWAVETEDDSYNSQDSFIEYLLDEMFIAKDAASMRRKGHPVVLLMSYPEPLDVPGDVNYNAREAFMRRKPSFYLGLQSLEQVEGVRQAEQYAGMIVRVL